MAVIEAPVPIVVGGLSLDCEKRTLVGCKGEVALSNVLFGLAQRLFRRPGVFISQSDLISTMYPNPDEEPEFSDQILRKRIMLLRATITMLAGERVKIRNERGIGYVVEVRRGA